MTKHTPGPWAYSAHYGLQEYIVGGSEHHTARIHMGEDRPFAEADARLIAAAPDMLDALEVIIPDLDALPPRVAKIVRAAIRKARS